MKEDIKSFSKLFSFLFYHMEQKGYERRSANGDIREIINIEKYGISRVRREALLMTSLYFADLKESVTKFTNSMDVQLGKKKL